jgi:type IX secretion system PorP/SprF family membrane protein
MKQITTSSHLHIFTFPHLHIITLCIFLCSGVLLAQPRYNDEQGNLQYRDYELLLNPASIGDVVQNRLSFGVFKQWTGIEGAPLAEVLQYQMPLAQNSGFGAWLHNESYGVQNNAQLGAAYAYKIRTGTNILSFGIHLSLLLRSEHRVTDLPDPSDPSFAEPPGNAIGYNAGFGAYYAGEKFYAGFSIPQLLTNDLRNNSLANGIDFARMHYYFTGGYHFDVAEKFRLSPSALAVLSGATEVGYAVMLTAAYDQRFEVGAGWAAHAQLQLALGAAITKNLSLRYQFSQEVGGNYHAGTSHSIVLRLVWGGIRNWNADNAD